MYIISNVQTVCYIASSAMWKILIIGHHDAIISCYETYKFVMCVLYFLFLNPISRKHCFTDDLTYSHQK
jgi:hypothetical protein